MVVIGQTTLDEDVEISTVIAMIVNQIHQSKNEIQTKFQAISHASHKSTKIHD